MSATSSAAWASMQPHIPTIKRRIGEFIAGRGELGATREEIGVALGIKHQSVNGRLCELEKDQGIVNSLRTRPQSSGRHAVVWVAPEFGPAGELTEETDR